jgi:hypothetical protein
MLSWPTYWCYDLLIVLWHSADLHLPQSLHPGKHARALVAQYHHQQQQQHARTCSVTLKGWLVTLATLISAKPAAASSAVNTR